MSRPTTISPPGAAPREGSLDEVDAVLCAIVRLTSGNGDLPEEARAVYSLACIAIAEWRLLDASDTPKVKP